MSNKKNIGLPGGPNYLIQDQMGQWKFPGLNTRISLTDSDEITMAGVPHPVLAYSSLGESILMEPGKSYRFPGAEYVDEFPLTGGNQKELQKWGFLQPPRGGSMNPESNVVFGAGLNYLPTGTGISGVGVIPTQDNPVFKGVGSFGVNQNLGRLDIGANLELPFLNDWATGERLPIQPQGKFNLKYRFDEGGPTPAKAREMLRDGTVHGRPLTDKQKRYFGYIANAQAGMETDSTYKQRVMVRTAKMLARQKALASPAEVTTETVEEVVQPVQPIKTTPVVKKASTPKPVSTNFPEVQTKVNKQVEEVEEIQQINVDSIPDYTWPVSPPSPIEMQTDATAYTTQPNINMAPEGFTPPSTGISDYFSGNQGWIPGDQTQQKAGLQDFVNDVSSAMSMDFGDMLDVGKNYFYKKTKTGPYSEESIQKMKLQLEQEAIAKAEADAAEKERVRLENLRFLKDDAIQISDSDSSYTWDYNPNIKTKSAVIDLGTSGGRGGVKFDIAHNDNYKNRASTKTVYDDQPNRTIESSKGIVGSFHNKFVPYESTKNHLFEVPVQLTWNPQSKVFTAKKTEELLDSDLVVPYGVDSRLGNVTRIEDLDVKKLADGSFDINTGLDKINGTTIIKSKKGDPFHIGLAPGSKVGQTLNTKNLNEYRPLRGGMVVIFDDEAEVSVMVTGSPNEIFSVVDQLQKKHPKKKWNMAKGDTGSYATSAFNTGEKDSTDLTDLAKYSNQNVYGKNQFLVLLDQKLGGELSKMQSGGSIIPGALARNTIGNSFYSDPFSLYAPQQPIQEPKSKLVGLSQYKGRSIPEYSGSWDDAYNEARKNYGLHGSKTIMWNGKPMNIESAGEKGEWASTSNDPNTYPYMSGQSRQHMQDNPEYSNFIRTLRSSNPAEQQRMLEELRYATSLNEAMTQSEQAYTTDAKRISAQNKSVDDYYAEQDRINLINSLNPTDNTSIAPPAGYYQMQSENIEPDPAREETKYSYVAPNRVERMLDAKAGFDNPYIRYNAEKGTLEGADDLDYKGREGQLDYVMKREDLLKQGVQTGIPAVYDQTMQENLSEEDYRKWRSNVDQQYVNQFKIQLINRGKQLNEAQSEYLVDKSKKDAEWNRYQNMGAWDQMNRNAQYWIDHPVQATVAGLTDPLINLFTGDKNDVGASDYIYDEIYGTNTAGKGSPLRTANQWGFTKDNWFDNYINPIKTVQTGLGSLGNVVTGDGTMDDAANIGYAAMELMPFMKFGKIANAINKGKGAVTNFTKSALKPSNIKDFGHNLADMGLKHYGSQYGTYLPSSKYLLNQTENTLKNIKMPRLGDNTFNVLGQPEFSRTRHLPLIDYQSGGTVGGLPIGSKEYKDAYEKGQVVPVQDGMPTFNLPEMEVHAVSDETQSIIDNPPTWLQYSDQYMKKNKRKQNRIKN